MLAALLKWLPKSQPQVRAHLYIKGCIYDASYHTYIERQGQSHGLHGWMSIRDAFSSSPYIELEVEGGQTTMEKFITDARRGPPNSSISRVMLEWLPYGQKKFSCFRRVQ